MPEENTSKAGRLLAALGIPKRSHSDARKEQRQAESQFQSECNDFSAKLRNDLRVPPDHTDNITAVIDDWQSARSKSLKRFLLGIGLVIVGAGVIGADPGDLAVLGLRQSEGSGGRLSAYIIFISLSAWLAFEVSHYIDRSRRHAEIAQVEYRLSQSLARYRIVKAVLDSHSAGINELLEALNDSQNSRRNDIRNFYTFLQHYDNSLRTAHSAHKVLADVDLWAVRLFSALSITALAGIWGMEPWLFSWRI